MNMLTVARTSNIRAVGLCHCVQGTLDQILGYIGEKSEDVAFICGGINHMAFYLRLEKDGQNLYPRLFEAMHDPKVYNTNRVRFEMMQRLGYFVTESSEHNAEYSPYFIPHGKEMIQRFDVPIDEYLRRCDGIVDEFERMKTFSKNDEPMEVHRSHEYGSLIIHSMMTGTPRVVYGNMVNNGAVSNLPDSTIVELPTLVDRAGLQQTRIGEIPPQLVAYMNPHISLYELFIRAALEGRRDYVYQACMFDPLTAATLTLDQIVEMCDELIEAHGELLPKLDAKKTLVPTSGKSFAPPTPQELRASWDETQAQKTEDCISEFQILSPFPAAQETVSINFPTPFETDFLAGDGCVDLSKIYGEVAWEPATANKGYLNFLRLLPAPEHYIEYSVGYAYFEIESIHQRETVLKCGSSDSIKIWLNGKEVLSVEAQRSHIMGSDEAPIFLKAGVNRFVVKVDQKVGPWGFSISVPRPNF
jgi:hypothetical protein